MLIILLCAGDKRTQQKDITKAKKLTARWEEEKDGKNIQSL